MSVSFSREDFKKFCSKEDFDKIVNITTVPELLHFMKANYLSKPAIGKEDGNVASYSELLNEINNVCGFLKSRNVQKGTNVGVLSGNNYTFAVLSLAIMAYGCVAVLIPAHLDSTVVYGFSKKYALSAILYQAELSEKVSMLDKKQLLIADFSQATGEKHDELCVANDVDENDPACIIMTGGTTGRSKGAVLSHTALMCGMINGTYGFPNPFGHTYYCIMPLTHVFGFIRNLLTSLYTGGLIYFCKDKKTMFNEMQAEKPSILVIVPALAELFLNLIKAYGPNMLGGNVKVIICGAASVAPYLTTEYNKLGILFCGGYGLTEFANMVSGNPDGVNNPESVGMLFPDQEAQIVDGELWLKGRNMMLQYYNEPDENAKAFQDGWFKTGDLARFDENNNLYIIGRCKDVIVLQNGENVSPAYIESKVNELSFVQDSLVTEVKNEYGAEILQVEVVLRPSVVKAMNIDPENINQVVTENILAVNNKLQEFERISKVVIRDKDFDRTPAMKIIRPKKVF